MGTGPDSRVAVQSGPYLLTDLPPETEKFWKLDNPIAYGVVLTAIILLGYIIIGFRSQCIGSVCEFNFQIFWKSDPNEIGDTLAGLFSALAFVWIIVTVFLQSHELREQRKEFEAQRKATEDMADAMGAQARIFEAEELQRKETYSASQASRLFVSMRSSLLTSVTSKMAINEIQGSSTEFILLHQLPRNLRSGKEVEQRDTVELLILVSEALAKIHPYKNEDKMILVSDSLHKVKKCLSGIVTLLEEAGTASRIEYDYETLILINSNFDRFVIEK